MDPVTSSLSATQECRLFDTERLLRAVSRIMERRTFESEDEVAAFHARFVGRSLEDIQNEAGTTVLEEAQDLAFRAMETEDPDRAASLARQALDRDESCLDAEVVLARSESESPERLVERLTGIIEKGGAHLELPVEGAHEGRLWGILEARPYLRARLALAETLESMGRYDEAIPELKELLQLNEPDNQGARLHLLRCHLAKQDYRAAKRILKKHWDENSAFIAWAAVLENVGEKAGKEARRAFHRAQKMNPFFAEFLSGRRELPSPRPAFHRPGSPEEAAAAIRFFSRGWRRDRERMNRILGQDSLSV